MKLAPIYAFFLIWAFSGMAWGEVVVIVNKANSLETISRSELQLIYRSQLKVWEDNQLEIKAVHLPSESPLKKSFVEEVLKLSYISLERYFQSKLSAGKSLRPPPATRNEASAIAYVRKYEGALAYISKETSPEELEGVKIISVHD